MKKNIIVKVQTPVGERHLTYRPVKIDAEDEILCVTKCPYGGETAGLCDKLRDPRDPENPNSCFMAFCQEIDVSKDLITPDKKIDMNEYIPGSMTIEDNLMDVIDVNKDIIRTNPCIRLSKVIDSVCSGWCPSYCPDHSNCSSKNISCIIPDLLKDVESEVKNAEELAAKIQEEQDSMLDQKDKDDKEAELRELEKQKDNGGNH